MTKEERDKIVDCDHPFEESPASYSIQNQMIADIALQLTRLADQGEERAAVNIPSVWVDPRTLKSTTTVSPSPADDLAKAVERVVTGDYSVSAEDTQNDQRIFVIENILRSALAAYNETRK